MTVGDPQLEQALDNLSYGPASDPDSYDKEKPLVTPYPPPNDFSKVILIENHCAYTFVTIPVENLTTKAEEQEWIDSASVRVLKGLHDIMKSPEFRATVEKIGETRRQNYIKKLYSPSMKTNLVKFLNASVVKVTKNRMLTDLVTQSVSNDIIAHLYRNCHSHDHAKYSAKKNDNASDEEDYHGDSTNDNNEQDD